MRSVLPVAAMLSGCELFDPGGTLGDACTFESDCAEDYSCVRCSIQSACYFSDLLDRSSTFEYVCDSYGAGTPTDPRYVPQGGGGGNCSGSWTCGYDGQATPLCQSACLRSGSERAQTCKVLACFVESGDAGDCCSVCSDVKCN
jgi:hypothetical protein